MNWIQSCGCSIWGPAETCIIGNQMFRDLYLTSTYYTSSPQGYKEVWYQHCDATSWESSKQGRRHTKNTHRPY